MATNRGLTPLQSFQHFDEKGHGFVEIGELVEGLAKLGIGIGQEASEILMGWIGRRSKMMFDVEDLEVFATSPEPPFE